MKKAKVILTAITVLAVVSGALAFKAHNLNGNKFCAPDGVATCNKSSNVFITYATASTGTELRCTTISATPDCSLGILTTVVVDD